MASMTAHQIGEYIVHAESDWTNGNSITGLAVAVHLHQQGKPTPDHVVHTESETCEHCPAPYGMRDLVSRAPDWPCVDY